MDPNSRAAANGLARAVGGGDDSMVVALTQCFRSKCQRVVSQAIGKGGACDQRTARRSALQACRPVREAVKAEALREVCGPYVDRMRPALFRQLDGDAAAVEARVRELADGCAAAELKKDKRYTDCVSTKLQEALA
eukprot:CAMPEP_0119280958 /NCGR_PEP_ID=MMETSP1329-20130426/23745_1 /TAXON_ID=114041 /ORGANISM="Genus nov. species nov., Strain RCC1024" /LENGTH=135 /DNA_ID=CAMNT_0007281559 /DNA_START=148 /DNA_END=551 /DNA_ORIENTATION=+